MSLAWSIANCPGRPQARDAYTLQTGLHLSQPRSVQVARRYDQTPRILWRQNLMGEILCKKSRQMPIKAQLVLRKLRSRSRAPVNALLGPILWSVVHRPCIAELISPPSALCETALDSSSVYSARSLCIWAYYCIILAPDAKTTPPRIILSPVST